MTHTPSRRGVLLGAGAALGVLGLGRVAVGAAGDGPSFLFVFVPGGWDPTRVFALAFDHPSVDVEPDAAPARAGSLSYVAHASRPSVDAFFGRNHARTLVINGLLVPSVQHEVCTRLVLTGSAADGQPDWASRIAVASTTGHALPHLVCGGPSFPGPHAAAVARTGSAGQLDALLTGDVIDRGTLPLDRLSPPAEALVDRYLARRAAARALVEGPDAAITGAFAAALDKAQGLKELRHTTDFSGGAGLVDQAAVAVDALSRGISRCVTIAADGGGGLGWDTHDDNDARQAALFEQLFADLGTIVQLLERTPGARAARLADEVVLVVLSEMGRTPLLNGAGGKDHWPYTSAMLVGPGLTGSRVVGGYDAGWFGARLDPATATLTDQGVRLGARSLGATLLQLAGIDPADALPGAPVLADVLV